MIQAWNFHHMFFRLSGNHSDRWLLRNRLFSRWPPLLKIGHADIWFYFHEIYQKCFKVMIQSWNFHHTFLRLSEKHSDRWSLRNRSFSRWPPLLKIDHEEILFYFQDTCEKGIQVIIQACNFHNILFRHRNKGTDKWTLRNRSFFKMAVVTKNRSCRY